MGAEKKVSYDLKRFAGIKRDYNQEDVERLRGSIKIEYSICKQQSTKLWNLLNSCLLYTSPSPRDKTVSRMPSSA